MVIVVLLTVFVWAWAVRRPASVDGGNQTGEQPTATVQRPLVYAAIGASDVVGVGADNPTDDSWASLLHAGMPPDTRFVRLGRNGITLREANAVEIPAAISAQPDLITMWNCVNDALRGVPLADYVKDLDTALSRLTRETEAQIVVVNMPDVSLIMRGMLPEQQRNLVQGGVKQWNKAIADKAAAYGDRVHVVDIYPASDEILEHPEYISSDNFHPSSAGYKRLAEIVWETIERDDLLTR